LGKGTFLGRERLKGLKGFMNWGKMGLRKTGFIKISWEDRKREKINWGFFMRKVWTL